jgi:hypothetical protein
MFQRVSGPVDRALPEFAKGIHPHPAFRMHIVARLYAAEQK